MLLGRAEDFVGTILKVGATVDECVSFADAKSAEFQAAIDTYVKANDIDAPAGEPDPNEPPMPNSVPGRLALLDLAQAGVTTIIWCVGFDADFSWLKAGDFDERGVPLHHDGVSDLSGLYFVGLPWLSRRKSGILLGVPEDASRVAEHLIARVA